MKIYFLRSCAVLGLGFAAVVSGPLIASETVTYTYDAKGRLVKVERSGTVNDGVTTEYQHDDADNRKRVITTGSD